MNNEQKTPGQIAFEAAFPSSPWNIIGVYLQSRFEVAAVAARRYRPLPSPAAPAGEEKNLKDWKSMYHELAASAGDQLAQLRKELEEAKQKLTERNNVLAFAGVREIGYKREIDTLTTENAALKEKAETFRQEATHTFGEYKKLEAELATLRSQLQWKPVSTLPTEKDADADGNVWVVPVEPDTDSPYTGVRKLWYGSVPSARVTHWMTPIPLPTPVPTETEEEKSRKEFEEWAEKNDYLHQGAVTIAAWSAWKAAKSTGGQV